MLAQTPTPVVLVTHDREEALALGDSVHVLDGGRVIAQGTPLEVLGQPGQGRVARLVGVENLFRLQVETRNHRDGTMTCRNSAIRLEAPLDDVSPNGPPGASEITLGGAGFGHYSGHQRTDWLVSPQPAARSGHQHRVTAPWIPGHLGLRRTAAVPRYRGGFGGNGDLRRPAPMGDLQGVILLLGR